MTELVIHVPDYLCRQAEEVARREKITLDQLVGLALSAQVSAWITKGYTEERARQGSWEKVRQVLAKAPDTEPPDYDRMPE